MNLTKSLSLLMNQDSYCSSLVFFLLCCWRGQMDPWLNGHTFKESRHFTLAESYFCPLLQKDRAKFFIKLFHLIRLQIEYQWLLACECVYVYKMKCKALSQSKRAKGCKGRVIAKQCRTWGSQPKCPFRNGSLPRLKVFREK